MDGHKEEPPRLQEPEEDEDCYILNVQSSSGDTNGSSVARGALRRQTSCILNVRSRSGGTSGSSVARRAPKRQASSVVVIDSDSDEECHTHEEKKAKLLEINSDDESLECCHVKPAIQEPPIVISDDDNDDDNGNDLEVPDDNRDDSEAPDDNSDDSEAPGDNGDDSEAPDDNGDDSEAPDDNGDDSEAPDDSSDDSDVPDDNSDDSDVSEDNSDDSDVSEDNSDDSDVPDDKSDDSDVPDDNSDDSEAPDDNSDDSEAPDDNSDDSDVPDDNSDDLEVPVPAEDLCNEGQIASDEEELDEAAAAASQHDSSDDAGEQDLGENLSEPPSDPEANLEVSERKLPTEEEPAPVVEQSGKRKSKTKTIVEPLKQQKAKTKTIVEPLRKRQTKTENIVEPLRKRKAKTRNVSVTLGHKKRGPSKKKPGAAKVEKRKTRTPKCKVPGCFLQDLEKSKKYSGKNLQRNKDELVQRIYDLFNRSVCDKKLPEKLPIGWNNKMVKTAGLCSTGEMWYPKRQRFAKIQISLKVCDSADRIRDTLIHEMCHAASWLIDGIHDSHGDTWKYYARKSNRIHPELPRVTRCHNYKINYKVHYECTGCKTRIGRYTKSLDTSRFTCAKCKGSLVMVPSTQKDGTRLVPHV
ncbi:germ cell nuclear acidic protein isoform X1 [Pongo pygmaeus]|uniref:GCNA isoform 1 n=1 Tax=Pongo abelii TaxID=9601 RepID=A0A2J8UBM2_PONAB|nr:germ cell nuclear acidic protein isoform X1 [Pongo pygmaeus]XP_054326783.1 germ cell nuclear acidic protein isoform X1 [Pongo pygmaeus]XP_054326784.1 germ cell nuclear acidic protein isoform X1 [Pongo pygmaeus]XP_054326785.1 germ cell nuclear acidic protein isoform X1 [Pongo pygmaeus]PNJ42676.1 GCNA isoform 1 [Pongo abelii]PNJ42677.1 GCNA isoform 2 [Pongo abelii]